MRERGGEREGGWESEIEGDYKLYYVSCYVLMMYIGLTGVTIDRSELSTGSNQVMLILIGNDGNELFRQIFTLTCKFRYLNYL